MKKSLIIPLLLSSTFVTIASAAEVENIKSVSQELVKVRQDIEELHSKITFKKDQFKDNMRSYSNQKSDLDIKISRNELKVQELQRDLKKLTEENKKNSSTQQEIVPILNSSIAMIQTTIKDSIPFKKEARLQALSDIQHRLNTGIVTPNKVVNQLWAFIEDEMMIGQSSGLYNDTVVINGDKKLVKVLKLGKIAIFFKDGEQYGLIKKQNNRWTQEMITKPAELQDTAKLYDTFSKQIRTGKFTMTNIIPEI